MKGRQKRPVIAELTIDEIAPGGLGVARSREHGVVLVSRVIQGEIVRATVRSGRPARGEVQSLVVKSPQRVEPPCPLVATCGGCDFQHMALDEQARTHARIVLEALAHATGQKPLPTPVIHAAPHAFGYRTRARLHAVGQGGAAHVGYRRGASHAVVSTSVCAVLDPRLETVLATLPEVLRGLRGEAQVHLALGLQSKPVVDIATGSELSASTFGGIDHAVQTGVWAGARVALENTKSPMIFGDPRARMEGADGLDLVFAAGAFAQPSEQGARLLATRVAALADLTAKPRHIVELFAGSGTLSVLLAVGAASFTAVEAAPDATRAAQQNLSLRGLPAKIVTADADTFALPPRTDLVVLDPPRTGARGATHNLAASRVREVLYVACDPVTLARDMALLVERGFVIDALELFELFPQTSHVETVVRAKRHRA